MRDGRSQRNPGEFQLIEGDLPPDGLDLDDLTIDLGDLADDLPSVELPPIDELIEAIGACEVNRGADEWLAWLGSGRVDSEPGALPAVDRPTSGVLPGADPDAGEDRPRSWEFAGWAMRARLSRTVKGTVVPVKSAPTTRRKPLDRYRRLFDTLLDYAYELTGIDEDDDAADLLDPGTVTAWWLALYTAIPQPLPVGVVEQSMFDYVSELIWYDPDDPDLRPAVHRAMDSLAATAERLGAVESAPIDADLVPDVREFTGQRAVDPREMRLTPLGVWAVNDWLKRQDIPAPVHSSAVDALLDLADLLARLAEQPLENAAGRIAGWMEHHPEDGAGQVEALLTRASSGGMRAMLVMALTALGPRGISVAERVRTVGGAGGAMAAMWLGSQGHLDEDAIRPEELALAAADQLDMLHESGEMIAELVEHPRDEQLSMIRAVAGSGHPGAARVLKGVSDEHPDKAVRGAASKERNRLHSR